MLKDCHPISFLIISKFERIISIPPRSPPLPTPNPLKSIESRRLSSLTDFLRLYLFISVCSVTGINTFSTLKFCLGCIVNSVAYAALRTLCWWRHKFITLHHFETNHFKNQFKIELTKNVTTVNYDSKFIFFVFSRI